MGPVTSLLWFLAVCDFVRAVMVLDDPDRVYDLAFEIYIHLELLLFLNFQNLYWGEFLF